MLNIMKVKENTSLANISILIFQSMLRTWSPERDRNISNTCVFIFHHSIQHDGGSGYTFYYEVDCPN